MTRVPDTLPHARTYRNMTTPESRLCPTCGQTLPRSEFGGLSRRPRSRCRKCHALYMRGYRLTQRAKEFGDVVRRVARLTDSARLANATREMLTAFGGFPGFVTRFQALLHSIDKSRQGSRLRFSAVLATF